MVGPGTVLIEGLCPGSCGDGRVLGEFVEASGTFTVGIVGNFLLVTGIGRLNLTVLTNLALFVDELTL